MQYLKNGQLKLFYILGAPILFLSTICTGLLLVLATSVFTSINLDVLFTYVINNKHIQCNVTKQNSINRIFLCLLALLYHNIILISVL